MVDLIGQKIRDALFKNGTRAECDVSEARKIMGLKLNVRKSEYPQIQLELERLNIVQRVSGNRKLRDPSVRLFP